MEDQKRYGLADLARVTGVTPRTVRYYIAQGLLPGANETGPGATYDERHLARLRLIRRLAAQHLPLAEIRTRLAALKDDEIRELLEAGEPAVPATAQTSALEYIRGVLGTSRPEPAERPAPLPRMSASTPPPAMAALRVPLLRRIPGSRPDAVSQSLVPPASARPVDLSVAEPSAVFTEATTTEPPTPVRSQWDRVALTPDIELHVRRPLSRQDNRRLERLITIARQVLGEEQP